MTRQLSLIESPPEWRLDDRTREVGRRGVAEARAALRRALASPADSHHAGEVPGPTNRSAA
jgi:hypothetical protein